MRELPLLKAASLSSIAATSLPTAILVASCGGASTGATAQTASAIAQQPENVAATAGESASFCQQAECLYCLTNERSILLIDFWIPGPFSG